MGKRLWIWMLSVTLAGCATIEDGLFGRQEAAPPNVRDGRDQTHPRARPGSEGSGATTARTPQTLDTTGAAKRARATAPASGEGVFLGMTVASLGAVDEPGIWLKTPLTDTAGGGRVEYPAKGTAVAVELIPLDAGPGAGSRISLAAMRLLEADLTALPELRVFRAP